MQIKNKMIRKISHRPYEPQGKCPYRTMYEKVEERGGLVSLKTFKDCVNCSRFGYFFDEKKEKDSVCEKYEKIMQAREFVKRQLPLIKARVK